MTKSKPSVGFWVHWNNMFDITYDGSQHTWHQNPFVGISCGAFALFGTPSFVRRGHYTLTAWMLFTSICSFLADYVYIENPAHVAHQIDRVVAHLSVACLCYCSLCILHLSFAYCCGTLALAVCLFLLSRSSKHRTHWAIFHTLWHFVPLMMIFLPDLLLAQPDTGASTAL
mmetsp:Transcript_99197/g.256418  ORF Transcript_99197/g.256418 Transcript_99197/m.256418 type:complete len:171 (+) Transcript_99197:69-581(+)